jgi:hypothetical protein
MQEQFQFQEERTPHTQGLVKDGLVKGGGTVMKDKYEDEEKNKLVGKPVVVTDTGQGEASNAVKSEERWAFSWHQGLMGKTSVAPENKAISTKNQNFWEVAIEKTVHGFLEGEVGDTGGGQTVDGRNVDAGHLEPVDGVNVAQESLLEGGGVRVSLQGGEVKTLGVEKQSTMATINLVHKEVTLRGPVYKLASRKGMLMTNMLMRTSMVMTNILMTNMLMHDVQHLTSL